MAAIRNLEIDLETFSSNDLSKCGVYKYAESADFDILLFGYAVDGGEVQVVDLACGEEIPVEVLAALSDEAVTKWAFNAAFERVCLSEWLKRNRPEYFESYSIEGDPVRGYLDPASWKCSMVWSAYMGLPLSLEGAGAVLGLEEQKLKEGKDLIRYFCVPCRPTKANGGRTRNLPGHDREKWERFKAYNRRDVEVEMSIQKRLMKYPVPETVWEEYRLDQEINDRGIRIDLGMVENAIRMDTVSREELSGELRGLTGVGNPNSVAQMKEWLSGQGVEAESLGKKDVAALMGEVPEDIREVLSLRQQLAKSSVKKYQAMQNAVCADGRARGMFQFYGGSRTGRWAGRIIQLQNLPQNHMEDLAQARGLVEAGDYGALSMLYDSVPNVLSELIRTAFVPEYGKKFIVADFSAIEARVLAWLAGERWVSEVFEKGGDIYCETAARMFHCRVEKHGENAGLRQKGKQATLSCIAEGQLVLTDRGLVPIEDVTLGHLLWDGESWVSHEGVLFKGTGEVITYGGLTATPDHIVWIEGQPEPVQLGYAASCGAHLIQTGDGGRALRLGGGYQCGKTLEQGNEPLLYTDPVHGMREYPVAGQGQSLEDHQRKVRLYDIRNAGRHHRFTVSGKLVHNCGYGGSSGALKAMGALEAGMTEDELQPLVDSWRAANPNIVRFWWDVDRAVKNVVKGGGREKVKGITFYRQGGMLFIGLPSGRRLSYVKPRIGENRFGGESVTYMGIGGTKKWERIESYGPKFVENIVQAVSRDILCHAMRTLRCCSIVAHVHDELIIEADRRMSLDAVCGQMGRTPPWAEGLVLRAEGYEAMFYQKS